MTPHILRHAPRPMIALLGAPIEDGAGVAGTRLGPAALRAHGLSAMLRDAGCPVIDCGNVTPSVADDEGGVSFDGCARNPGRVARWTHALSDATFRLMEGGFSPLVLGGDHSLSMGAVDGVARYFGERGRKVSVLWLDAHPDLNTPSTSPSGNMHGMALAALCGEPELRPIFGPRTGPAVEPGDAHVFGVRSIDFGEFELAARRGIDMETMERVRELGVARALGRVLEKVARRGNALYVSFDADFLDPAIAPGVGTPVPGGANPGEARLIMEMLRESGLVVAADIVELNPSLDRDGRTVRTVAELAATLFGQPIIAREGTSDMEVKYGRSTA